MTVCVSTSRLRFLWIIFSNASSPSDDGISESTGAGPICTGFPLADGPICTGFPLADGISKVSESDGAEAGSGAEAGVAGIAADIDVATHARKLT